MSSDRQQSRGGVRWAPSVALLLVVAIASGCDDDSLRPPRADAGPLFDRYVAMGNSITAGLQSGGINELTQMEAYPVLFAAAAGTDFNVPLLNLPGCPPPYVNIFTGERQGGGGGSDCALRVRPVDEVIHNVAVPQAATIDIFDNAAPASNPNPLTTILLGGRTQMEAARDARPTFVSAWIGSNDVLGAAQTGELSSVTPPDVFADRYGAAADSIADLGIDGAGLIGIPNVTVIPHLSPGAAYWQADRQGALPPTFTAAGSCAPEAFGGLGEVTLVPFAYGFGELLAAASRGEQAVLDCAADPRVLTPQEIGEVTATVSAYNATIRDIAGSRGWAYYDPNPVLDSLRAAGEIPFFPATSGSEALTEPFGRWFSRDGIHPSGDAHRLLARGFVEAVNATYGSGIPLPEAP